jgi:hypothetical protein
MASGWPENVSGARWKSLLEALGFEIVAIRVLLRRVPKDFEND